MVKVCISPEEKAIASKAREIYMFVSFVQSNRIRHLKIGLVSAREQSELISRTSTPASAKVHHHHCDGLPGCCSAAHLVVPVEVHNVHLVRRPDWRPSCDGEDSLGPM